MEHVICTVHVSGSLNVCDLTFLKVRINIHLMKGAGMSFADR